VLRLAITDEQMHVPPRWSSVAELIVMAYHRTWAIFSTSQAVSTLAPPTILTSSMAQLTVPELWFLRDVLEQGAIVNDEDAASVTDGNRVVQWRTPLHSYNQGCLRGGPPARPVRPIDLRARPIRVKRALTSGHGKSDLPYLR
jgi:hypothetical protein